jgi:dTMP kinase
VDRRKHEERRHELDHHARVTEVSRGAFIVFEGVEGVGKTTQLRRLAERLGDHGIAHLTVREPGGTPVGDDIRRVLLESSHDIDPAAEVLLFAASRAQNVRRVIVPALETGALVLVDRFVLSSYAYQMAGYALDEDAVRAAMRLATGGLKPDLTLLLRLDTTLASERTTRRGERDRIERMDDGYHRRVAAAFESFAGPEWQLAHPEAGPIELIDASGSEEAVARRIGAALADRFPLASGLLDEGRRETLRGAPAS